MNTKIYSQQQLEDVATELRRGHTWELFIFVVITMFFSVAVGFIWGVTI